MTILVLLMALALLPATAAAQVVPTPTVTPGPSPEPTPEPAPPPPLPPFVAPPPPGTQTVTVGFDLAHSFYSADPAATPPLGAAWTADLGGTIASPLVADGRVFVSVITGNETTVVALDAASGRQLWRSGLSGSGHPVRLAYSEGTVVGMNAGRIYALDAASGAGRWTREDGPNTGFEHPVAAHGLVYAQGNSVTRAYDLATGEPRFDMNLGDGTQGAPAIAGDRLYMLGGCRAAAYDRRDGREIWRLDDRGCTGGGGYVASLGGRLLIGGDHVIDADTGARVRERRPGAAVLAGDVEVAHDRTSRNLVGRNLESGAPLWTFQAPDSLLGDSLGGLAAAGETVFWRFGGRLYALDRRGGAVTWSGRLTSPMNAYTGNYNQEIAIGDGLLLAPYHERLYALSGRAKDPPPELTVARGFRTPLPYGGSVYFSGSVKSDGIAFPHRLTLEKNEWPFRRGFAPVARAEASDISGGFSFSAKAARNAVWRVSLAGGAVKAFPVVVVPRIDAERADRGGAGRLRVKVRVPRAVRLRGVTVGAYLGQRAAKRYTRLGSGRLSGRRGSYRAMFSIRTVRRMARRDFVVVCIRGIHRRGMSFGDRLDRQCGAPSVRF